MPPFQTLEEEADYWDTHSVVEGVTGETVVGFHKAKKTEVLPIRFAPEDLSRLREQADEQGIGPTTLARMWILTAVCVTGDYPQLENVRKKLRQSGVRKSYRQTFISTEEAELYG